MDTSHSHGFKVAGTRQVFLLQPAGLPQRIRSLLPVFPWGASFTPAGGVSGCGDGLGMGGTGTHTPLSGLDCVMVNLGVNLVGFRAPGGLGW